MKQLSINLITQILAFAINVLINFFLTPFIVNYLGEEVYGFVGLANNFTSYIYIFTLALNGMLGRYITIAVSKKDYKLSNVYFSTVTICNLAISLILLIPTILLCFNIDSVINISPVYIIDVQWLWLGIMMAFHITLIGNSFSVSTFVVNRLDLTSTRQLISYFARAVLLLTLFCFFRPHVWYVGLSSLVAAIVVTSASIRYTRTLTPYLKVKREDFQWSAAKELIGTGIWNSINQLSVILQTGLDLLIANLFISPESMGLLSIAKVIPTQLQAFYSMMSNIFAPKMTYLYGQDNMSGFLNETKFAMRVCGFIGSLPIAGFIVFGLDFFTLWMNNLTPEKILQIQALSILTLIPNIFGVFVYPLYTVNTITCKLKVPVLVSLVISILNILIVFILLNTTNLGIYAIAGVSSILLLFRVLLFSPLYAAHSVNEKWPTFYPPIIKGSINLLILWCVFTVIKNILPVHSWSTLLICAAACGITGYSIGIFILFSNRERMLIASKLLSKLGVKKSM